MKKSKVQSPKSKVKSKKFGVWKFGFSDFHFSIVTLSDFIIKFFIFRLKTPDAGRRTLGPR
ncbi:MAG: hypothetical protein HY547_00210 [Elusimicrobia bacterium]|nr:hypothetical protein [Elusimicrobiota bacterium]